MNILDVIKSLHDFRENVIIGSINDKEVVDSYYKGVLPKYFKYILCGELAELFKVKLEIVHSFMDVRRIFIWSHYLVSQFDYRFDDKYIMAVVNDNKKIIQKYEHAILFDKKRKGTHAVLELLIDGNIYIVDPTVGIVYPNSIKTLITYKNSYSAYQFMDQYKYIMNSIHMVRPYMFVYSTPVYWENVQSWHYRDEVPLVIEPVLKEYIDYFRVEGEIINES